MQTMRVHAGNARAAQAAVSSRTKKPDEKPTLRSTITKEHIQGLKETDDVHKAFNKKRTVDKLNVDINGKSAKIMHIAELLLGHKDSDLDFAEYALSHLKALSPKEKPDVVLCSGLIFGGFQHREKNSRRVKTMTVSEQLSRAKQFIDRLQDMGMTVVYNKSDNDQKIIEDYTYDAVKTLEGVVRERGNDRPTSFAAFDRVQQSRLWQSNYEFQWDVVFEYMLRSGRNLLTKEEVHRKARQAGEVGNRNDLYTEEYLLLIDAHKKLERGEPLTSLQNKVLEVKNIPYSKRKPDKLIFTDDYNLKLKTKGRTTSVDVKHEFKQSATSMTKDPTRIARKVWAQKEAAGEKAPDAFILENAQLCQGVMQNNTLFMSLPGMTSFNYDSSSYTRVPCDKAQRMTMARGEVNIAGIQEVEFHDDGRISIHLMNDALMNIAAKTSERHAAIFFSDWQTGSSTARPDLAVKALDYALHTVLPKEKGMIFPNGDIIEGRNYPEMPNQNGYMNLVDVDDQVLFVYKYMREILEKMPEEAKKNLLRVLITVGNHEWNSGRKFFGATHSLFLKALFDAASDGKFETTLHSKDIVRAGTSHFKSSTAITELANYKVLTQHYILEGGTGLPINQFQQMLSSSAGPLMKEINLMEGGHWHHPQYAMTGNKIAVLSGSLAGLGSYEWWKGINPVMGTTIVHLGGNKPPEIEFLTPEFLYNYKCKGAFSDSNLAKQGFTTDRNFDPNLYGYGKILLANGNQFKEMPQSATQKKLWSMVDGVDRSSSSKLY